MPTEPTHAIAIGGSAGALEPLLRLLGEVPVDLPAPIVVGLHSRPESDLMTPLKLKLPHDLRPIADGDMLEPGVVHVIPPARHAFFQGRRLAISDIVEDSGYRPSIDALFMSLASSFGPGAIAVVLSGMMHDGMRGAQVIYDMGGRTLVQDPDGAKFDEMPESVIRNDHPDAILPPEELGRWITRMVG